MYLIKDQSEQWVPYFGHQRAIAPFVIEVLRGLGFDGQDFTFAETNAGTHAVSYAVALEYGKRCSLISNDISLYSVAIGRALAGRQQWTEASVNRRFLEYKYGSGSLFKTLDAMAASPITSTEAAAIGAVLVEVGGYDFIFRGDEEFDSGMYGKWVSRLSSYAAPGFVNSVVPNMDLFDFILGTTGDVLYMDFAWPWKYEEPVQEYGSMVSVVSSALVQHEQELELWNKGNVVERVMRACREGVCNFKYVILSNQSSNYPTPQVLEPQLYNEASFKVLCARYLTVPAKHADNRGLEEWFTEYQYILQAR